MNSPIGNSNNVVSFYDSLSEADKTSPKFWDMDEHAASMKNMTQEELDNITRNISVDVKGLDSLVVGDIHNSGQTTAHPTNIRRIEHLPASAYGYAKKFGNDLHEYSTQAIERVVSVANSVKNSTELTDLGKESVREDIANNTMMLLLEKGTAALNRFEKEFERVSEGMPIGEWSMKEALDLTLAKPEYPSWALEDQKKEAWREVEPYRQLQMEQVRTTTQWLMEECTSTSGRLKLLPSIERMIEEGKGNIILCSIASLSAPQREKLEHGLAMIDRNGEQVNIEALFEKANMRRAPGQYAKVQSMKKAVHVLSSNLRQVRTKLRKQRMVPNANVSKTFDDLLTDFDNFGGKR